MEIYAAYTYRRLVWNELPLYARAGMEIFLSGGNSGFGRDSCILPDQPGASH